jgi:hypothetical protein
MHFGKQPFVQDAALDGLGSKPTLAARSMNILQGPIRPPDSGSSRVQFVYGGAQCATFLATGFFTGESTQKPVLPSRQKF